jgi:hypothetical protein
VQVRALPAGRALLCPTEASHVITHVCRVTAIPRSRAARQVQAQGGSLGTPRLRRP